MSSAGVVVTQLIVDASGSRVGVEEFKANMAKAKQAAVDTGQATASSFEQAQKRWVQALASTDPVIRAQIRMEQELQRQREIGIRATQLGVTTLEAHGAQMEKVRRIQQGYVDDARKAAEGTTMFGRAASIAATQLGPFIGLLSVGTVLAFGKSVFEAASSMDEMAQQAGVTTEGLQAYRAVMLQAGIATEATDKILSKLTLSIGSAIEGAGKQRDAFVRLGVSIETLRGGAETTLPAVAKGLLAIEDSSVRARLEVDLFGKSGQKLESALKTLIDPTATLIEKQKALGQVMGTDVTEAADKAADSLAAAWNKFKVSVAPGITDLMTKVTGLLSLLERANNWLKNSWLSAPAFGLTGFGSQAELDAFNANKDKDTSFLGNLDTSALLVNGQKRTGGGFSTQKFDEGMATLREQASLVGKTAEQQAIIVALREQENRQLADGNGKLTEKQIKEITSLAGAKARYEADQKAAKDRHDALVQEEKDEEAVAGWVTSLAGQYEREGKAIEAKVQRERDFITDLEDDVRLVGMSADERERESAVLNFIHLTDRKITEEERKRITGLVAIRQEMEKQRQLVDGIANSFQDFFTDVLDTGKASFGDLWDSIKHQFNQMLAYMASQALIQPIIIPIVQSLGFGGGGGLTSLFGGGSGGGIGNLLSLGSTGSNLLGLGAGPGGMFGGQGLINGIGGMLGFATPATASSAAGLSGALGGISRISAPAMNTGGLFGATSFGSFLGGAGLGSLAGSLIFGNKNDASMGSMGGAAMGAAIGSIIPGVGTIIGGLLGGVLGGGLGSITGSSNQGAISNFTNDGLGNTLFKAGGGQNGQMATQAAATINETIKALRDASVNVGLGNISGLSIGSDKSYVYDFAGGKQKLAGGQAGIQATVNAILDRILPSINSDDAEAQAIIDKYRNGGGINSGNIAALANELQQAKADKEKAESDRQEAITKDLLDRFTLVGNSMKTMASTASDTARTMQQLANGWRSAQTALQRSSTALGISAPGLSPIDSLNAARAQFGSLRSAALGGNLQANNDIASFASQFLQNSYQFNGATVAYNSDYRFVKDTLDELSTRAGRNADLAQQQADAAAAAVAELQALAEKVQTGNDITEDGLATLNAQVATLNDRIAAIALFARTAPGVTE